MTPQRFGKYQVTGRLGKGAMGEVFRAHDPVLGRDVAIKVLSAANDERTEALLREAQAAAQLNHPNIITIHDFGREQDLAFMAMELLDGSDLREKIEKKDTGELEERLYVMSKVLDGMAFAHERGIVHRDLKPGNVRILGDGQVKVLDFGLARRNADAGESGTIRGTPYYMAPEQVRSERATERSDVFALGAMFFELLTGQKPFPGSSVPAVLYAVVHDEPPPLGQEVPPLVAAVILRALRKDPRERFANAGEMRDALSEAWLQPTDQEGAATAAQL
jgi:serine/threonine-protein kinase